MYGKGRPDRVIKFNRFNRVANEPAEFEVGGNEPA
jgi:hypothetical protein